MKPFIEDTVRTLLKNYNAAIEKDSVVNVKQLAGSFTMDTVIQVAFGTKVDSLVETDNPIICNAKKLFSVDMSITDIIKFTLLFMAPQIAKFLKIEFKPDVLNFFETFSGQIISKKREDLSKSVFNTKATSFLELLLEAEAEDEKLSKLEETEKTNEFGSKKTKCKFLIKSNIFFIYFVYISDITNDELLAQCVLFFIAGFIFNPI